MSRGLGRWFRFSLRTLLFIVTLLAIWLGLKMHAARQQADAVAAVQKWPGAVRISYDNVPRDWGAPSLDHLSDAMDLPDISGWLVDLLGFDLIYHVVAIEDHPDNPLETQQRLAAKGDRLDIAPLENLAHLKYLAVSGQQSDDHSLVNDDLRHVSGLVELQRLKLDHHRINDEGLLHLADLKQLYFLDLTGNQIKGTGLSHLADHSQLTMLVLRRNDLEDDGVAIVKRYQRLLALDLGENPRLTDACLEHLEELPNLAVVDLSGTRVTAAGIQALQRARPNLNINHD